VTDTAADRVVPAPERVLRTYVAAFILALCAAGILRTAWMSDDAYITLRTVDNIVHGYGARWNVAERVQTYTHPLWMLALIVPYAVTHDAYFTPLALSIALSLAAVWFLVRSAATWRLALLAGLALACSKAFIDYATSGLENCLSYFLLSLMCVFANERRATKASLMGGLLLVNRLDLAVLVLPPLAWNWRREGMRGGLRLAFITIAPLACWEVFSVVYYGFPFPNTAYAKLFTSIPLGASLAHGGVYLLDSLTADPVTLVAITLFSVTALLADRTTWPTICGIVLYLAYVVWIGGDFMSGRFLGVVLVAAVAAAVRSSWTVPNGVLALSAMAFVALGVFATARAPLGAAESSPLPSPQAAVQPSGISDERAFYFPETGLLRWRRTRPLPATPTVAQGKARAGTAQVVEWGQIGIFGFYAGPAVHVVDIYALGDPLLARLPAEPDWRVGHYRRAIPAGYLDTLRTGRNVIADPRIGMMYERLKLITRGPLWSRRRWRAMITINP
jgi:arabinofuranosyltransferase